MSSRHRNLEPLGRWHTTIYSVIYMYIYAVTESKEEYSQNLFPNTCLLDTGLSEYSHDKRLQLGKKLGFLMTSPKDSSDIVIALLTSLPWN